MDSNNNLSADVENPQTENFPTFGLFNHVSYVSIPVWVGEA